MLLVSSKLQLHGTYLASPSKLVPSLFAPRPIRSLEWKFQLDSGQFARPGSHFCQQIRPHLTLKWLEVDLKSTTCNWNDLTRLGAKTTDFGLQVDFGNETSGTPPPKICIFWPRRFLYLEQLIELGMMLLRTCISRNAYQYSPTVCLRAMIAIHCQPSISIVSTVKHHSWLSTSKTGSWN